MGITLTSSGVTGKGENGEVSPGVEVLVGEDTTLALGLGFDHTPGKDLIHAHLYGDRDQDQGLGGGLTVAAAHIPQIAIPPEAEAARGHTRDTQDRTETVLLRPGKVIRPDVTAQRTRVRDPIRRVRDPISKKSRSLGKENINYRKLHSCQRQPPYLDWITLVLTRRMPTMG